MLDFILRKIGYVFVVVNATVFIRNYIKKYSLYIGVGEV